jgi:hypothetical protein
MINPVILPPQPDACAIASASARGLRTVQRRCFCFFAHRVNKKYAAHFFNHVFGVTEPKEAPFAGADREVGRWKFKGLRVL